MVGGYLLTLSRTFNPITYTNRLTIFEVLAVSLPDAVVVVVGKMRHVLSFYLEWQLAQINGSCFERNNGRRYVERNQLIDLRERMMGSIISYNYWCSEDEVGGIHLPFMAELKAGTVD